MKFKQLNEFWYEDQRDKYINNIKWDNEKLIKYGLSIEEVNHLAYQVWNEYTADADNVTQIQQLAHTFPEYDGNFAADDVYINDIFDAAFLLLGKAGTLGALGNLMDQDWYNGQTRGKVASI